jgi:hypothetical protein
MPVPTLITDLSTTAGSNYPLGTDSPSSLDDVQRAHASFIAGLRDSTNIHAATSKTTPVDADEIHILDSASTYLTAKLTWANLKATLLSYFSNTTFPIGSTTPSTGSFTTLSASGNITSSTASPILQLGLTPSTNGNGRITFNVSNTATNWVVSSNAIATAGSLEITPSTVAGGSTFTTPVATFSLTGLAVTGALSSTGALTTAGLKEDTSGNLGLGFVPSAWNTTYKALDIGSGGAGLLGGPITSVLSTNTYLNSGAAWIYKTTGASFRYDQSASGHIWYTAPSGTAGTAITFTQALAINASGSLQLFSATTAAAPAYVKGAMYFDTTLNKLRIGGATAWETVTSV